MISLSSEQRRDIVESMMQKYEEFKVYNSWALTNQMEDNYREGMIDILDSMIEVLGAYHSIYDIATLRNAVEEEMEKENGNS